jgi:hypothetical protein
MMPAQRMTAIRYPAGRHKVQYATSVQRGKYQHLSSLSVLWFVLVILLFSRCACAQTSFGSISGTVTDISGAVVPDAKVTLTDVDTHTTWMTTSNAAGLYEFVNLNPAHYAMTVGKAGFSLLTVTNIVLQMSSVAHVDIALHVGAASETVTVSEATIQLQTDTSSLGQVIGGTQVQEMPLNGRNVFNLMTLVPSVVPQGAALGTPVGQNGAAWNNYQINGGFAGQSIMYLDGAPVTNSFHNEVSVIPAQDFVQEFKVETSDLGPEWGRFAGGVMNVTTKSGTKQFHATAYEYIRNKVLNANTFFNNGSGLARPAFTQNQYGVNGGGPLAHKMFWFGGWEDFRLRQGQTWVDTVPTLAERSGDFSSLKNSSGTPIPIYNPFSVCGEYGNPACATNSSGQPIYTRTQFPENKIPPGMISNAASQVLKLWPLPNATGQPYTNVNNFVMDSSVGGNTRTFTGRIDRAQSDKQSVFARFSYWDLLNLPDNPLGTGVCLDECEQEYKSYDGVLNDTYIFTPQMVATVNVSILDFQTDRVPLLANFDLTSIGWPAAVNSAIPAAFRTPPTPNVQGEASDVFSSQGQSALRGGAYALDIAPSLSKMMGKHTLLIGGEFRVDRFNYGQTNIASGYFSFDSGFTQSVPVSQNGGAGGFGLASYLLGVPSSGSLSLPAFTANQQIYRAFYFGDTWKTTRKLTLNLGIRYDLQGQWSERFNRLSVFNPSVPSSLNIPGLSLPGQFGLVDSTFDPSRNNFSMNRHAFAPRLGFAYAVTPKTVVHGAYGIFWLPNNIDNSGLPNNDSLNTVTTTMVATTNGGITPYNTFDNPFPTGVQVPVGRPSNTDQFCLNLGGCAAFVRSNPFAYMQQWNFDVQREFPSKIIVDAAYSASKGTHLPFAQFANQLPDQYLSMGSSLLAQVANPFYGLITDGPLSTPTIAQGQLLRPFPQYGNFNFVSSGQYGASSYNSLQVKAQRPIAAGGILLVAYTWAKLLSNVDDLTSFVEGSTGGIATPQDWNNLNAAWTLSSDNVPQRAVISYVAPLPFGHGRRLLSTLPTTADKIVAGWGIEGITTFQDGFPLKLTTSVNQTQSYSPTSLPNALCGDASFHGKAEARLNAWFNTSCFAQPAPFTFGTEPRVDPHLREQDINNWDFTAYKNTAFGPGERFVVQFRSEFFNLFNKPEFGPPGTTFGNAQFGVVSSQVNNPRLIQFALRFSY